MPKFCPECGKKLEYDNASFCPNCGFKFRERIGPNKSQYRQRTNINEEKNNEYEEPIKTVNLKDLGNKLEKVVEEILIAQGYQTQRNTFTKTNIGMTREIDILARRSTRGKEKILAVECKNYANPVPLKDMEYFVSLLEQKNIPNGLFVTSNYFTKNAEKRAELHGVQTWDRDELQEKHLMTSIGRIGTSATKEKFRYGIPEIISYQEAVHLELQNKEQVDIDYARLVWKPINKIKYQMNSRCRLPNKELRTFNDKGTCYVNALDGSIISLDSSNVEVSEGMIGLGRLVKKTITGTPTKNEIIEQEIKIKPERNIISTSGEDYQIIKINPNVRLYEVKKIALNTIRKKNSGEVHYEVKTRRKSNDDWGFDDGYETRTYDFVPKTKDIYFESINLVYIPKWEIKFSCKDYEYEREIFANSGKVLTDHISICPQHKLKDYIRFSKKNAVAVCEICGNALCEKHVFQCPTCGKWLCDEHSIQCASCQNHFCNEHIHKSCKICDSPLCDNCETKCPICREHYCERHMVTCDKCGRKVCINCSSTSRSKLLFKKYICSECS